MVYDNDLLPCSKNKLAAVKGDRHARSHECGADVGETVIVAPSFGMPALEVARNKFVELFLHVLISAGSYSIVEIEAVDPTTKTVAMPFFNPDSPIKDATSSVILTISENP